MQPQTVKIGVDGEYNTDWTVSIVLSMTVRV